MFYTITHLKAPWPKGAVVGDVIELGPVLPAWAAGKAVPAGEGARATVDADDIVVGNGAIEGEGDGSGRALPTVEAINLELADLREKLAAAGSDNLQLQADKDAALADAADLREKLAAAEAAAVDAAANGNTTAKKK